MATPERFSSLRGVDSEMLPREVPLPKAKSVGFMLARSRSTFKNVGSLRRLVSSMTVSSSHFCDLEDEDGDDYFVLERAEEDHHTFELSLEESSYDIEKQKPTIPKPPQQNQPTPKQKESRLSIILLDQGLFTVYKRLFLFCSSLNITGLILAATGNFPYAKNRAALFSIGNIFVVTLCRSEIFFRALFWLAVKILGWPWIPLCVKTSTTAILQSVGGIHSGCGVSSIAWLTYALVLAVQDRENSSPGIIGVASTILALLCITSVAAFPLLRHLHHNVFERTHRFAGWTALALVWVFVILTTAYDPTTESYSTKGLGSRVAKQQEFWLTLAITILIAIPWLTVRRVPVQVSAPANHASLIKFQGGVKPGILGRISPSPLSEWHAFGIISDGNKEHMMLAGAVGDFTKSLVSNPPSHLWVRQVHFAGLPYLVNMYNKVLLVATGSGICVVLSFMLQPCAADVHVIWVAKGMPKNYGEEIVEMVNGYPKEKMIVHDSGVAGRPDVSQLSVTAAKNWGVEVVIVTSNPEESRDVVNTCNAAGIAAFGPVWDS